MTRLKRRSARSSGDIDEISGACTTPPAPNGTRSPESAAGVREPYRMTDSTISAMMATAGTPHFSAFGARAGAACDGFPWVGEPQLWQNRESGLSFVPQSLQNRGFSAG